MDSVWILYTLYGFFMDSIRILNVFRGILDGHHMDSYIIINGFDKDSVWTPCGLCMVRFVSFRVFSGLATKKTV